MTEPELKNIEVCRACLSTLGPMVNIFCMKSEHGITLSEMFARTSGLPVSQEDSYPKTLCPRCLPAMIEAYEIQKLIEKNAKPEMEGWKRTTR